MLMELSKMEQRYDAVLGVVRDGFTITEVARKFGISRRAVHVWLVRYEEDGLDALADRSHRPVSSPTQIAPSVESRVESRRESWRAIHLNDSRGCSEMIRPSNVGDRNRVVATYGDPGATPRTAPDTTSCGRPRDCERATWWTWALIRLRR